MIVLIRSSIIFLAFVSCVHLQNLCSSYFTISHQRQSLENTDKTAEFSTATEIACALRCNTKNNCDKAAFNRDTKKCSLYRDKDKDFTDFHASDVSARSRILTMRKVRLVCTRLTFPNAMSSANSQNVHGIKVLECFLSMLTTGKLLFEVKKWFRLTNAIFSFDFCHI